MKNIFGGLFIGLFASEWWIKVTTAAPECTYYFGPFDTEVEALVAKAGYIEDLEKEGAQQIMATISRQNRPDSLTVEGDSIDGRGGLPSPVLSS
mgnify:CR=1 FL=1